jgi:plasmid stabilization system protein ParE
MRIEWSGHAVSDLKQFSEYIEADRSLEVANRISRSIYDAIQSLKEMPNRGRSGRVSGTRELSLHPLPYVVVDRVQPERVLILSIVHGAQRWP